MYFRFKSYILIVSVLLRALCVCVGDDEVYQLPEYEVTAWHFDQSVLDVAADVVRIDRETIDNTAAASIPDLLRAEANIIFRSFNGKGNQGEAALRGFGEGSGLRVLVLVDGIKVNRSDMGSIEWQLLPLRDVESVEVLRGGHNVLYGNHALSGVIKVTTRKGGQSRASISAFGGTDGYQNYDASIAGSQDNFFYRVNGNYQRDEGYRDNSLSWTKGGKLNFGYFLNDTDELSTNIAYSEGYLEFPGPLTYEQFRDDPTRSESGGQDSESDNFRQTISWMGERDWGEFEVHGGYYIRELEWSLDGVFGDNDQDGLSVTPKVKIGDGKNFITFGFDVLYDTIDFTDFTTDEREYVKGEADLSRWTTGAYVFAQRSVSERVSVSGGVRYERAETDYEYLKYDESQLEPYDPIFGDPFNPNPNFKNPADIIPEESYDDDLSKDGWAAELSVNCRVSEKLSLWAGYDRVYRYPVLDEVAAYQGFPLSEPLNADLDPEEGDNYECGLKYRDSVWEASVTLFYLHLENEIAFDDEVNLNVNLGATDRIGTELSLSYDKSLYGASTQWTFVDATFDGGDFNNNRVPLVPWVNGSTQVWVKPFEDWRVSLLMNFVGDRYAGNDDANEQRKLSSYALYDVQFTHDLREGIKLFARVNNVFDKQYVSTAFSGGYYLGAGRSFIFGLNADF